MAVVVSLDMLPLPAQVALLDATWQDYPDWEDGNEQVAFRARSPINPHLPPYPGFAVTTRPDTASGRLRMVRMQVWTGQRPDDLRKIHDSVLHVGRAGVVVGNEEYRLISLDLPRGDWPLEIWVDAAAPGEVSRVVFALPTLSSPASGRRPEFDVMRGFAVAG